MTNDATMAPALDDTLEELSRRAARLPIGTTYTLRELAMDDWEELSADIGPHVLGRAYSMAVQQGRFAHSQFDSVDRTPRQTRYLRIAS